jgi:Calcineurin-like phosphoesterase
VATAKHSKKTHRQKHQAPRAAHLSPRVTTTSGQPVFAQPRPSPNPTGFVNKTSDLGDYRLVDPGLLEAVPGPRGGVTEPVLTLGQTLGAVGTAAVAKIQESGQIVFHAVGDTGSVRGPLTQSLVADKMVSDFDEPDPADIPSFFFHLGDVVYSFGEGVYYYEQFYEPHRNYPAPIVAIPGNHDGGVYKTDPAPTLEAFLRNFCSENPGVSSDAGGLSRTTQIQPSVFFTFDAPFVRILGLYSNVLEDPGVISSEGHASPVSDVQLAYFTAALRRARSENYAGAVIVAVHHPPFTYDSVHSASPRMLQDMDQAATAAEFWPHAVLSGHAHNYERFTRQVGQSQIPYIVAGCGGHRITKLQTGSNVAVRTPARLSSTVTFENYDDTDYGYLRIIVTAETLRIEFHPASDGAGAKTPDDVVTVDLKGRTIS